MGGVWGWGRDRGRDGQRRSSERETVVGIFSSAACVVWHSDDDARYVDSDTPESSAGEKESEGELDFPFVYDDERRVFCPVRHLGCLFLLLRS